MAVPEQIKKHWIEIQKKYDEPVNAIGVRIDPNDSVTLKVWRDEGIDQFRKHVLKQPSKNEPVPAASNGPQEPSQT
jgi:hypothetical protein